MSSSSRPPSGSTGGAGNSAAPSNGPGGGGGGGGRGGGGRSGGNRKRGGGGGRSNRGPNNVNNASGSSSGRNNNSKSNNPSSSSSSSSSNDNNNVGRTNNNNSVKHQPTTEATQSGGGGGNSAPPSQSQQPTAASAPSSGPGASNSKRSRIKGSGGGGGGGGNDAAPNTGNNRSGGSGGDTATNNSNNNKSRSRKKHGGPKQLQQHSTTKGGSASSNTNDDTLQQKRLADEDRQKREEKAAAAAAAEAAAAAAEEERKRREEEEARQEQMRKQEEARRQKEALEKRLNEAKDTLCSLLDAVRQHQTHRASMTPDSLSGARKEFEATKKKLKTDLKKCTAFVKKVKSGSAWSMKPGDITKDVAVLNLSRYVEEVVSAILEGKPKVADLPVVLALCTSMHQRYPEFLPNLVPTLWNCVNGKNDLAGADAKIRRSYLRLLTEFILAGLLVETKPLMKCMGEATGGNKDDDSFQVTDANMVVAFCKSAGFEILGVTPRAVEEALHLIQEQQKLQEQYETGEGEPDGVVVSKELFQQTQEVADTVRGLLQSERVVTDEVSDTLRRYCLGAYKTLSHSLVHTHGRLQKLEKRCEQDRLLSGSLTEAREKGLNDARKLKESLEKSVEALSEVLNQSMPHLEEAQDDDDADTGVGVEVWTRSGEEGRDDFGPFNDEETRAFYCDIPDFLTTIPPALLGMTQDDIEQRKEENALKYGTEQDGTASVEDGDEALELAASSSTGETNLMGDDEEETADGGVKNTDKGTEDHEENKDTPHYKLTVLLEQELPECNRREQIDELSEKFCTSHGTSKKSRKRLMEVLFQVPRTRLDLLPFYSRMTATLDRVWSDIGQMLVTDLEQQFHGQAKFKKNQNIDSRLKTARFVGELIKFRVAPPMVVLRCLKRCLEDFTGNNVDIACCLLESCGRFLDRMKHTSSRLATLMETMTRLGKAKNLDERHQSLLKAAFYCVKPPTGPRRRAKEYPPLEAYLRHLFLVRLEPTDSAVSLTTKQLVRLPWSDPSAQCGSLVCKLMLKACRKGRYRTIKAIAAVAANIRTQRAAGEVTIRLIDSVLEELRWALESPSFRDQQRIVTYTRLLGELYCTSQVSAQIILQQLYDFINVGHEIPDALREASKKLALAQAEASAAQAAALTDAESPLPVYNSAGRVSQTIQEDEEVDEAELETTAEEAPPSPPQPVAVSQHSKYDPRVPTPTDPPNSAYRVKLVCTLLEVVTKPMVSRTNLPRLEAFLAAFQRYLFTKVVLPTEVEFALLDVFDVLDSQWRRVSLKNSAASKVGNAETESSNDTGFPRYMTWLDAHNATVANEEAEAIFESQKRARLEALLDESKADVDADVDPIETQESLNDDSAGSMDDEEEDATASILSGMDSVTEGNEDEAAEIVPDNDHPAVSAEDEDDEFCNSGVSGDELDESDYDDTDDDDDDEEEEEEFDEEAYMRQLEEEAFEREFRRVTMEALEKGKNASRKQVADCMPSGTQIIKKKPGDQGKPSSELVGGEGAGGNSGSLALGGKAGISFQVLKKGNKGKVEARELVVPSDTNLAIIATKQDDEAARERDVIKQRVLQYEAESAESEYSNVYLEQEKLQVIRNRPLSMEDIDRNFGTTGGQRLPQNDGAKPSSKAGGGSSGVSGGGRGGSVSGRGGGGTRGGGGGGRGRGRSSSSGRMLFS